MLLTIRYSNTAGRTTFSPGTLALAIARAIPGWREAHARARTERSSCDGPPRMCPAISPTTTNATIVRSVPLPMSCVIDGHALYNTGMTHTTRSAVATSVTAGSSSNERATMIANSGTMSIIAASDRNNRPGSRNRNTASRGVALRPRPSVVRTMLVLMPSVMSAASCTIAPLETGHRRLAMACVVPTMRERELPDDAVLLHVVHREVHGEVGEL